MILEKSRGSFYKAFTYIEPMMLLCIKLTILIETFSSPMVSLYCEPLKKYKFSMKKVIFSALFI